MTVRRRIYFDGGCRPNPGPIEVAVVARGEVVVRDDLGNGSNIEAEWQALIAALELALERGEENFELVGDALAVIEQARGKVAPRGPAIAHHARFAALAARAPKFGLRWVPRGRNLAGIALAARHPR